MAFYADLHVHSKYSRATSRNCDLEHLALWGRKKGIGVVGTGDFTHPAWGAELKEKLVPAEPGLYRLRPDVEKSVEDRLPPACRSGATAVRFMLSVEISTIYKKHDRTRKIHHLIYTPDFAAMDRVTASLSRIGNLHSDGRPILGLDSRHLLEIALESDPGSYLVPAHIWTPWFAALGSKSGFDAIDDCYGDLAHHVFAVETGLSSDPPMNWRVSSLDRFRLVSNSDAHSPEKLGREVCVFDTALDYFALRRALETGEGYEGTLEFFPEEGKYHLDGHRGCGVRLEPGETRRREGLCPVCGKPLTVGVMHRVEDLADRAGEEAAPPETAGAARSLIPLPEILAEIHRVGPKSKRVAQHYESLIGRLGPELPLLDALPLEEIGPASSPLVAEAVSRLRREEVVRQAGYDGVYGTIRLFEDAELHRRTRGGSLFGEEKAPPPAQRGESQPGERAGGNPPARAAAGGPAEREEGAEEPGRRPDGGNRSALRREAETPDPAGERAAPQVEPAASLGAGADVDAADDRRPREGSGVSSPPPPGTELRNAASTRASPAPEPEPGQERGSEPGAGDLLAGLDADQRRAAETVHGPLLIVAGPGSGKTRTLTHRLAHLVTNHAVPPAGCLAVTFTRRAAEEMRGRLRLLLPAAWERVPIHTFHSLGLSILEAHWNAAGLQRGFRVAPDAERLLMLREALQVSERRARALLAAVSRAKRSRSRAALAPSPARAPAGDEKRREAFEAYAKEMELRNRVDFDDLVIRAADALESDPTLRERYRERYPWVSIDEYQDVDEPQARLVRQLAPADGNVCAIGDPDQAIYGFRGADVRFFSEFRRDHPAVRTVSLTRNYRSDRNIVALSGQVIARSGSARRSVPAVDDAPALVTLHEAPTEKAEAEFIVQSVERTLGGHSFFSIDSGRSADAEAHDLSFSDFAVLYRTEAQVAALSEALRRSGMPFQQRSHRRLLDHPGVAALAGAMRRAPPGAGSVRERLEAAFREAASPGPAEPPASPQGSAPPGSRTRPRSRAAPRAEGEAPEPRRTGAREPHRTVRASEPAAGFSRDRKPVQDRQGAEGRDLTEAREACDLLAPLAVACGGDLERFFAELALGSEVDTWDRRADRISLLTLHAAKGLEFPVVFIAGCENGLLPLTWGKPGREDLEEERRLFYVGVTRARSKLYLCRAKKRLWRGKVRERQPSPYLADVEDRLLERRRVPLPANRAKEPDPQLPANRAKEPDPQLTPSPCSPGTSPLRCSQAVDCEEVVRGARVRLPHDPGRFEGLFGGFQPTATGRLTDMPRAQGS